MLLSILMASLSLLPSPPGETRPATAPAGPVEKIDYPKPDPADPVNYIEWINTTFGAGIKVNAADVYLEAFEHLRRFEGDWGDAYTEPWTGQPELERWLRANQEGLDLFRKAALMEACYFPLHRGAKSPTGETYHPRVREMLFVLPLPHLALHREGMRGLMARGFQGAGRGDLESLRGHAFVVLRAARHLDGDGVLLRRMLGFAGAELAYNALFEVLAHSPDPATAKQILTQLDQIDPQHRSLHTAMLMERLSLLDFLQRLFKPLPDSENYTLVPEVAEGLMLNLDNWFISTKILSFGYEQTVADVNRYFDQAGAWYRTPDAEVQQEDHRAEFLEGNDNILLMTALPSYGRDRIMRIKAETTRRALHLSAALLAQDDLEAALARLDADDMKSVRIDPLTGEPFKLKLNDRGFTLYSVGLDRKDQDGRHEPRALSEWDTTGDYVFWPRP